MSPPGVWALWVQWIHLSLELVAAPGAAVGCTDPPAAPSAPASAAATLPFNVACSRAASPVGVMGRLCRLREGKGMAVDIRHPAVLSGALFLHAEAMVSGGGAPPLSSGVGMDQV